MTALMIWSLFPGVLAFILYSLRRWAQAVYLSGVIASLLLAWLAWQFPIGEPIPIRLWTALPALRIQAVQSFFGEHFTLDNSMRPALVLVYASIAFWLGGAGAARTHRLFAPLGLGIAALFTAALASETLPSSALLFALAAFVSIPLVSAPGEPTRRGALRFLSYVVSGVCLIIFADGLIAALPSGAGAEPTTGIPAPILMLALGFSLALAVVPFHTWAPMLAEESNPYSAAFIFYLLPLAMSFLALEVLIRYSLSGLAPAMFIVVRYAGVLMVLAGGVGAAFERHLGRILGFAAIAQIGMMLLALSLNDQLGRATPLIGVYFAQMVPQGLGLALWGLALRILSYYQADLNFRSLQGIAYRLPAASAVLILANLSIAGLPLLASFPINVALWNALIQKSQSAALLSLLGNLGLLVAALRSLAVMLQSSEPAHWRLSEDRLQIALLVIGGVMLALAGVFPQTYLPMMTNLGIIFAGPIP
jgi:formate hydrogenlyase subunit 3/multisubunit Na+/H+ antiporter MnhD subunit